jgi:NAD(P)H-dependent FMN reductase
MNIQILSGTNRPDSNTRKLAEIVAGFHRAAPGTTGILDLAELPPEIFSPASYAEKPASFRERFSDPVLAADGLVIITPEYNGSVPGVLKYFIDMLKFPESFEDRPVCFVGLAAGMWGALRPVEQLQAIFGYRNAHIFPTRVFLAGVGAKIAADGSLNDPEIAARLEAQARGFRTFVAKLRGLAE